MPLLHPKPTTACAIARCSLCRCEDYSCFLLGAATCLFASVWESKSRRGGTPRASGHGRGYGNLDDHALRSRLRDVPPRVPGWPHLSDKFTACKTTRPAGTLACITAACGLSSANILHSVRPL